MLLLKKYGTDFHILSNFFPKKTKNQLKVLLHLSRIATNNILVLKRNERKKKFTSSRLSVCYSGRWNKNSKRTNRT